MVYMLSGRENIFMFENVIKWIILRNKILGNKNLFKVASTENKACLIKKKRKYQI